MRAMHILERFLPQKDLLQSDLWRHDRYVSFFKLTTVE